MTLFRQILLVIIVCFSVNLIGVLWLEFQSTRNYLANQLESDLNNTSTSMSMALQPHLQAQDKVMIDSTINTYFDGGFYERIELEIYQDDSKIVKTNPVAVKGVPSWFINLDLLKIPEQETIITDGWMQAATLKIAGHPGFAYLQLWNAFLAMCWWIGGLSVAVILVSAFGIRILLQPLQRIQLKAQQIQERNFGQPLALPKTLELRQVTEAINRMTDKLRDQFNEEAQLHDKLKQQAFQDATTGLGNRSFFNRQLRAWLEDTPHGAVFLLELNGLETIKKRDGFTKRDEIVKAAAQRVQNTFNPDNGHVTCRLSANEFAVLVQGVDEPALKEKLAQLSETLTSPHFTQNFYEKPVYHIGAVVVQHTMETPQLMGLVDNALQQARQAVNHQHVCKQTLANKQAPILKTELRDKMVEAINTASLGFSRQPVFEFENKGNAYHFEAFAQLKLAQMGSINAASFISVLDEYELGQAFDKKVIDMIIGHIHANPTHKYAINLTASALKSDDFIQWLVSQMNQNKDITDNVCFEFSEESVIYNKERIEILCEQFKLLGVQFGVDRVGRNFSSLSYLQSIHPNYVKIDHAYTQMALSNKDDAYFVGSLCTTIHNLDVAVIATRVENEAQLEVLKEYNFDGYQGFIYKPEFFDI
ncbi:GGDEF/EAL protein [Catenovulum agarivorans DS-2]|uniref:GGDEF/EAL protein n=1 Tax=Catenovulum agarivorans DS-2 TaxID=1328313 RepID=W7QVR8_9ALTE|nr:EAL domain-containing protein [Catenovulum agarivorans]EWH09380.1 GGDEF/EAL protein [Catenovulum agarivorans DS-2]